MSPMDGPMPGPGPFPPDGLYVDSLTFSNGFLKFDIRNLVPGDTYLLARKSVLDDNFTNYWVPQWSFNALDTNQITTVPFPNDSATGFYLVVDYDLCQGPSPTINSPADNSTVSGTIQVNASLTDIFPATQAQLFIDGKNFGTLKSGSMSFSVDTARLPNGSHTVELRVLSFIPFDPTTPSAWFSSAIPYNLNTSNFLAENLAPRAFTSELGTVPFAFDTTEPATVSVNIFDNTGTNLVRNISVTNDPAGTCYPYWDLTDNALNPVPLPNPGEVMNYAVVVSATPLNAPASASTRSFTVHIGTDAHAGRTAVFDIPYDVTRSALGFDAKMAAICNGTIGAVVGAYTVHPSDMDGWDRGINPNANPKTFNDDSEFPYFYTVLTNQMTGTFQFLADGDVDAFGSGPYAASTCTYIYYDVDIARVLGNSTNYVDEHYSHRVRLACIEACLTGGGLCNFAFGSPDDVDSDPALTQSCFVGWVTKRYITVPFLPDTLYGQVAKNWFGFWSNAGFDAGPGVRNANIITLNFFGAGSLDTLDRTLG